MNILLTLTDTGLSYDCITYQIESYCGRFSALTTYYGDSMNLLPFLKAFGKIREKLLDVSFWKVSSEIGPCTLTLLKRTFALP